MKDRNADLKFDRRLSRRRGWLQDSEFETELAGLPDVADKAETVDAPGTPEEEEAALAPEVNLDPLRSDTPGFH